MAALKFNFISNNAKGLKLIKKKIKLFEYCKSKLLPSGLLFAQETCLTKQIEQKWKDELNGLIFFSHGRSSSRGVFIFFLVVNQ